MIAGRLKVISHLRSTLQAPLAQARVDGCRSALRRLGTTAFPLVFAFGSLFLLPRVGAADFMLLAENCRGAALADGPVLGIDSLIHELVGFSNSGPTQAPNSNEPRARETGKELSAAEMLAAGGQQGGATSVPTAGGQG